MPPAEIAIPAAGGATVARVPWHAGARGRHSRLRWFLLAAVAAHLAVLAALIWAKPPPPDTRLADPQSFELVMDPGSARSEAAGAPGRQRANAPAAPPSEPASSPAAVPQVQQPAPALPPPPAVAAVPPAPAAPALATPAPATPAPATPAPPPPAPPAASRPAAQASSAPPDAVAAAPPPPVAAPSAEAAPAAPAHPAAPAAPPPPATAVRSAAPPPTIAKAPPLSPPAPARPPTPRTATAFPKPMDLRFGTVGPPGAAPPRPPASAGAPATTAVSEDGLIRVRGAHVGQDWMAALHRWWQDHSYYPRQAAARGEDGTVAVHVKVTRDGRVQLVDVTTHSGSQWLDMGAAAVFRGATLPPFPDTTPEPDADLDITIDYIIVRR